MSQPELVLSDHDLGIIQSLEAQGESLWAVASYGAVQLDLGGNEIDRVVFDAGRSGWLNQRRTPTVATQIIFTKDGGHIFVGQVPGKRMVAFDEEGRLLRSQVCRSCYPEAAQLREGVEPELVHMLGTKLVVMGAESLERRVGVLQEGGYVLSFDVSDLDEDGVDEVIVAFDGNRIRGPSHAVLDGEHFEAQQHWPVSEGDGMRVKACRIEGVPLIAHQSRSGLVLDRLGGERWAELTLAHALQSGRVVAVEQVDADTLAVVTWGDRRACDTLLSVFDLISKDTLLSVQYQGRSRDGVVVRDAEEQTSFWFSVAERLYRLQPSR